MYRQELIDSNPTRMALILLTQGPLTQRQHEEKGGINSSVMMLQKAPQGELKRTFLKGRPLGLRVDASACRIPSPQPTAQTAGLTDAHEAVCSGST